MLRAFFLGIFLVVSTGAKPDSEHTCDAVIQGEPGSLHNFRHLHCEMLRKGILESDLPKPLPDFVSLFARQERLSRTESLALATAAIRWEGIVEGLQVDCCFAKRKSDRLEAVLTATKVAPAGRGNATGLLEDSKHEIAAGHCREANGLLNKLHDLIEPADSHLPPMD